MKKDVDQREINRLELSRTLMMRLGLDSSITCALDPRKQEQEDSLIRTAPEKEGKGSCASLAVPCDEDKEKTRACLVS